MTPEQIETTLDQLVRRARYLDDREKWTYEDRRTWKEWKVKVEELRTAHGVVPFAEPGQERLKYGAEIVQVHGDEWDIRTTTHYLTPGATWQPRYRSDENMGVFYSRDAALSALNAAPEPPGYTAPPAPQPASEGVRWFRISDSNEDRFHEGTTWTVYPVGEPLATKGGRTWHVHLKINEAERQVREGNWVELDGPPPHGKPLAKPATEGCETKTDDDEDMELRASEHWNSLSHYTRQSPGKIVADFARSEIARATASLRAEVEAQKQRADANAERCLAAINAGMAEAKRVAELRAENVKLRAACRCPDCDEFIWKPSCGPTHAARWAEVDPRGPFGAKPTRRPAPRKGKGVRSGK